MDDPHRRGLGVPHVESHGIGEEEEDGLSGEVALRHLTTGT